MIFILVFLQGLTFEVHRLKRITELKFFEIETYTKLNRKMYSNIKHMLMRCLTQAVIRQEEIIVECVTIRVTKLVLR